MPQDPFTDEYDEASLRPLDMEGLLFHTTPRLAALYGQPNGYDPLSADLFVSLIPKGSVVVDVGAHHGYYTLLAARRVGPTGTVIAAEPVEFNCNVLRRNVLQNGFSETVSIRAEAVSDRKGLAQFNITEASDNSGFYDHPNTHIIQRVEVTTTTLDDLVGDCTDVSIVKIDAEGHENGILQGGRETLAKGSVKLLFEFNPKCFRAAGRKPEQVLETLLSLGYRLYFIDDRSRELFRVRTPFTWKLLMGSLEYRNVLAIGRNDDLDLRRLGAVLGAAYRSAPWTRLIRRLARTLTRRPRARGRL